MINFNTEKEAIDSLYAKVAELEKEVQKRVIGQDDIIHQVIVSIFSKGHCLLVGVPGLAKTLLVNTIAEVLGLEHSRIQFTPDLMPSDIVGSEILDKNREFKFIRGPLFSNVILADEINRTPPKTQAALLEAMQERAVTAAGQRFKLDSPFFVLATQNPVEQEGTYPLPEAQLDRFMFSLWLDYPSFEDELLIVKATTGKEPQSLSSLLSAEEICYYQNIITQLPVNDNVLRYAVGLAAKTRPNTPIAPEVTNKYLKWGAGPRASQYLVMGAKTHAALAGKYSPDIEDVKAVAKNILRHRIIKNYKAEAENISADEIIDKLL